MSGYGVLDTYDIGALVLLRWIDLCSNSSVNEDYAYRIAQQTSLGQLIELKNNLQKSSNLWHCYESVKNILVKEHQSEEEMIKQPIIQESRAYEEWKSIQGN